MGCVLTMVGTGSEMNAGAVITNPKTKQKIGHVFADEKIMPKFAILNPKYTLTLPHYQMVAGIYDIFNHICEPGPSTLWFPAVNPPTGWCTCSDSLWEPTPTPPTA